MIQFDRAWLARYLQMDTYDHILQQYLSLKTNAIDVEYLDADYMRAMDEIEEIEADHPAHITMINNRIMHMVERFFIRLYEKRHQLTFNIKAGDGDINAARKIERLITSDFSNPFPSIEELATQAGMSSSKLKKLFREIYKKPIYQYYQSARMQKARTMLLSGGHSVKSVGLSLGFSNLSNFSVAFRKEFNMLPGELVSR
jgi:AraC-like DNA-binding protein